MNLIGLPGNDQQTELWLTSLLKQLEYGQAVKRVAHYRHWDGAAPPDIQHEAAVLDNCDGDLVIAKSMGTMVLLQAHRTGVQPLAVVMIGVPVKHFDAAMQAALYELASSHTSLFIQQTGDFTGSFAQLATVLEGSPATLVEVSGGDHLYADTNALAAIIDGWMVSGAGPLLSH